MQRSKRFTVTFFISTARSGTQWSAATLNNIYPDLLVATHEPVGYLYKPKDNLRDIEKLRGLLRDPRIRAHFDRIHETIETRSYVEVGFPAFALAPLLREEFGDRLRLVQLTRHPVRVAASIVTHDWYREGVRKDIMTTIALTPTDSGVTLSHYAERWSAMTSFERALFYWYEVHAFGLEQKAMSPPGGFARFQFEKLVSDRASRDAFLAFLDLPHRSGWRAAARIRIDNHRSRTYEKIDSGLIKTQPEIDKLARQLGYRIDADAKVSKYRINPIKRFAKGAKEKVMGRARRLRSSRL